MSRGFSSVSLVFKWISGFCKGFGGGLKAPIDAQGYLWHIMAISGRLKGAQERFRGVKGFPWCFREFQKVSRDLKGHSRLLS